MQFVIETVDGNPPQPLLGLNLVATEPSVNEAFVALGIEHEKALETNTKLATELTHSKTKNLQLENQLLSGIW